MAQNPIVTIEMEDGGIMKAELYPEVAPNTVNNFISLIQKGYYDGLIFHRVIPGFMIQGGCPDGTGMGGPGYSIKGEFTQNRFPNELRHDRGAASSSSWWSRLPTWMASMPPLARLSRVWRWPTPSCPPSGTGTTSPVSLSA